MHPQKRLKKVLIFDKIKTNAFEMSGWMDGQIYRHSGIQYLHFFLVVVVIVDNNIAYGDVFV